MRKHIHTCTHTYKHIVHVQHHWQYTHCLTWREDVRVVCSPRGTAGVPRQWGLCKGGRDGWFGENRPLQEVGECLLCPGHPLGMHVFLILFHFSCHLQVVSAGLNTRSSVRDVSVHILVPIVCHKAVGIISESYNRETYPL